MTKIEIDIGDADPDGSQAFADIIARLICYIVGIAPVDPTDGSPNWWMFRKDAEDFVAEARRKWANPKSPENSLP